MLQLALDSVNCLNYFCRPLSLRDSCDIGFRVQFNMEFPRQVMNFPIEFHERIKTPFTVCKYLFSFQRYLSLKNE